jgi:hypothetical protein
MRQAEDPPFRDLLSRARTATLTVDDLNLLNSKAITSLVAPDLGDTTIVVKINTLRQQVTAFGWSILQSLEARRSSPSWGSIHAPSQLGRRICDYTPMICWAFQNKAPRFHFQACSCTHQTCLWHCWPTFALAWDWSTERQAPP